MKPAGYIWSGIGSGAVGVLVLLIAHSDDGLQAAMAQAQVAAGETPTPHSDLFANLIALALFAVAVILVLIGAVGAGVRSGVASSSERSVERR